MKGVAFVGGAYVPLAEARISVMTHAFNYGTGHVRGHPRLLERGRGADLSLSYARAFRAPAPSARILAIDLSYSVEELGAICLEILRRSGFREDVYIRPIAYKSGLGIGVSMTGVADVLGDVLSADRQLYRDRPRHPLLRQLMAAQRRQRHPAARQGHGLVYQRGAGQARGHRQRLRRGDHADRGRPCLRGQRGEHVHGQGRHLVHAAGLRRRAGRHHARHADGACARRAGRRLDGAHHPAHRTVHGRRGVPVRHRRAGLAGGGDRQAARRQRRDRPADAQLQQTYFDVVRGVNRAYASWLRPVYDRPSADRAATDREVGVAGPSGDGRAS